MKQLELSTPDSLGGLAVTGVVDYRAGAERRPRWLGATPLVALDLEGRARVLIRPSGTEPKLKIYVDLRAEAGDLATVEHSAAELANRIAEDAAEFIGLSDS
jgi:phosphomannomutase